MPSSVRSFLFLVAASLLVLTAPALAERRLGFVVGINAYRFLGADAQLDRAVADADAVGDTLGSLGFQVTRVTKEATLDAILGAFEQFTHAIEPGDTVVFYYAGHGISLDDGNYLVPADVPSLGPNDELVAKRHAIAERDIKQGLRSAGARVSVVVLDACRNNPFPAHGTRALGGTGTRGLARIEPAQGVYSLYSAREGQTALDHLSGTDPDRNSVFTRVFLKELRVPGVSLSEFGEIVRDEVATMARADGHDQVPAVNNDLEGARLVFLAGQGATLPAPAAPAPPAPKEDPDIAFNKAVLEGTKEGFEKLLKDYPDHPKKNLILGFYQNKVEEGVWKLIEQATDDSGKLAQLEMLLKAFPKGIYADRAKLLQSFLISKQQKEAEPSVPAADPAQQDFDASQAQNTRAAWLQFLARHPAGTLADLARFKLRETTPPPDQPPTVTEASARSLAPTDPQPGSFHYVDGLDPNSKYYWLALRNGPSFQASWSNTHMPPGTLLTVLEESGEWYHVRLANNETGWANKRYIRCCRGPGSPAVPPVTPSSEKYYFVSGIDSGSRFPWLALRSAPDPHAGWSDTHLVEGTPLTVLGRDSEWYHVRLRSGETGWASARFIACCKAAD